MNPPPSPQETQFWNAIRQLMKANGIIQLSGYDDGSITAEIGTKVSYENPCWSTDRIVLGPKERDPDAPK